MEQQTFDFVKDLTFSQAEPPAKTSQLQDGAKVVEKGVGRALPSAGNGCDWLPSYVRELSYGRMCSGAFPRTEGQTSQVSFPRLANSGIAWRGEYWTANTPEWTAGPWPSRSDVGVCGLSDVLTDSRKIPPKYFLSQRACLGVLRRAERRGKELPKELENALLCVIQQS